MCVPSPLKATGADSLDLKSPVGLIWIIAHACVCADADCCAQNAEATTSAANARTGREIVPLPEKPALVFLCSQAIEFRERLFRANGTINSREFARAHPDTARERYVLARNALKA